ncbi:MAG TPA: ABC transporter permease [Vicinamibacterales bacterium]|nr:ABC transporter permease [Vicinamibacterales bacterium]
MLESIWFDVKFAWRLLRGSPRNTALAIAILGLGIGANTAMFSAINYVLIRPLPFRDDARLLRLRDAIVASDGALHPFNMRARSVLAVRSAAVFDGVVAFSAENMTLAGRDVPERVSVVFQSDGFQRTLGVDPAVGRAFTADEERRGLDSGVALISDALWQSHFGALPSAIGSVLRLDDRAFTVIGIMPPQYAFPYEAQVWVPFVLNPADVGRDFAVFVHLARGVSDRQVADALTVVAADARRQYADVLPTYQIQRMPIRDSLVGNQAAPLRALTDVVAFLLLIASVNVATLLLARAVGRRREFAVRGALGATRARHVRQLLTESLLLAGLGCGAGLLVVAWIAPLTASLIPAVLSGQLGLAVPRTDGRVLAFAVLVSLAAAIVAGLLPAFGSWREDARSALTDGGRAATAGPRRRRLLAALIVAETALTLVLLVGAGLVIRNFVRLVTLPLGFEARGLLTIELSPPPAAYPSAESRSTLVRRIVEEVRATPAVARAAVTTVNPLGGGTWGAAVTSEEAFTRDPTSTLNANDRLVTPGLLETMGIRLMRGRPFSEADGPNAAPVVIVSDRLAHRLWPNADPIGKRVRVVRPNAPWLTVVGVAADVSDSHDPGVPLETWYRPLYQNAGSAAAEHLYVMVRTSGDVQGIVPAVERAIGRVDRTLAPYRPTAMDEYWKRSLSRERVSAALMLGFGVFGLALAALGVYGVMAFSVAQRTAEFGVRMALGAQRRDIVPLVLRGSVVQIAVGIVVGAAAAMALNTALSDLLTEVGAIDPQVVIVAAALIIATGLVACLIPAIHAARMNPVAALKAE